MGVINSLNQTNMKNLIYAFALLFIFSCSVEDDQSTVNELNVVNRTKSGKEIQDEIRLISTVSLNPAGNILVTRNTYVTTQEYQVIKTGRLHKLSIYEAVDKNNYSEAALRIKDINPVYDIPTNPTTLVPPCLSDEEKEIFQNLANSSCKVVEVPCCQYIQGSYYCYLFTFTPADCAQDEYDIYD